MKRTLQATKQPAWLDIVLGLWWVWISIGVAVFFYALGAYFQSPVYQMHEIGMG